MRRGPPPQPKHVLALKGSWRADYREELGKFHDEMPMPPEWMRPRAAAIFVEVCLLLKDMGVLAKTDERVAHRYAAVQDRWLSAEEELAKTTMHYSAMAGRAGEDKAVKPSAAFAQASACHDQLRNLETVLGLTPADRTRLGMAVIDRSRNNTDPMDKLLG